MQTTYTGVYRHGGPDTTDGGPMSLQEITNRKPADARGVQITKSGILADQILFHPNMLDAVTRTKSGPRASEAGNLSTSNGGFQGSAPQMAARATAANHVEDWDDLGVVP